MSSKTSTQPGRRTPLSLSGAVTKSNPIKSSNAANGGSSNSNSHTTSNNTKQDNKAQQQKTETQSINNVETKEHPNKRPQPQTDKKLQQNDNRKTNEKNQNGSINNNKQQQSTDSKQQLQSGNDDNKANEKDKKGKVEKSDKLDNKQHDKCEKLDTKSKENKHVEQEKPERKREEKKHKELKEDKEDRKEAPPKSSILTEQQHSPKNDDKHSKRPNQTNDKKSEEKVDVEEAEKLQQTPPPPVTPKSNSKANRTLSPSNKTPTNSSEKTPQKLPLTNAAKIPLAIKGEKIISIDDDIEMEPLAIESSPTKSLQPEDVASVKVAPSATSTPGKVLLPKRISTVPKSDIQLAMQSGLSPQRPRSFSQISGRKSIRPISDFTPSKFQNNHFRESYRRINTELDVTNTSMNVTVGSEIVNNLSFSFFGRGRKREHTPPQHSESSMGHLHIDTETSPPKKARIDMSGILSVVSSPLSLLRNRFSKASLQNSTSTKLQVQHNTGEDEIEVQNISGVSLHEDISKSENNIAETNVTVNGNHAALEEQAKKNSVETDIAQDNSVEADVECKDKDFGVDSVKNEKICDVQQSPIIFAETPLQNGIASAKNKRCIIM